MDQEDGEYLYNGMLPIKNEILPSATTQMDLEGIKWSKSGREWQILYDTTYTWNLKNKTKGSEYNNNNKKADSHLQRKD